MSGPSTSRIARHVGRYLDHLTVERGLAPTSLAAYRADLARYAAFLTERGIEDPTAVARTDSAAFVEWLSTTPSATGRPYAPSSIARMLVAVRGLHRFLRDEELAGADPTDELRGPRRPRTLPKALSWPDVERLLAAPVGTGPATLRDRAMLELLYAAGLRITELVGLDVDDVDLDAAAVRCLGKGRKERVVPIGGPAVAAVGAWRTQGRPALAPDGPALFVNVRGGRLTRQGAWGIVNGHARAVGLTGAVSPHTLRHSFATHLIENGADVRVVQELLGHANVTTTQIYTLVTAHRVRVVYEQAHPRARRVPTGEHDHGTVPAHG